jgi:hypothetical protein
LNSNTRKGVHFGLEEWATPLDPSNTIIGDVDRGLFHVDPRMAVFMDAERFAGSAGADDAGAYINAGSGSCFSVTGCFLADKRFDGRRDQFYDQRENR